MNKRGTLRERYPGPWRIEDNGDCIKVLARCGAGLAWIYYRNVDQTFLTTRKLSRGEARALARRITRLVSPHAKTPS